MQFTDEIQRLLWGFLLGLGIISLTAAYWAVTGPERLLNREDNPRLFEATASIRRGAIVDRRGISLVESIPQANNRVIRHYLYPAMNSALGYYSLRYGIDGAEAAYESILSGRDQPRSDWDTFIREELVHIPQQGSDIQLTFDLGVQQRIVQAMGGQSGAVVVLSVPDGAVLSMVSLPTFDPNTLDTQWDSLVNSPGNPFFNRALLGTYQPGGAVYTLLMMTAIIERQSLSAEYLQAAYPVKVGDVVLACLSQPGTPMLTLSQAYLHGCPAPFAQLVEQLGLDNIESTFGLFQLTTPPTLPGFVAQLPIIESTPELRETGVATPVFTLEEALGQGKITVTPLQMAAITASIINSGNAPVPYTLMATRPPGSGGWIPANGTRQTIPITTLETSRTIQELMRQNVLIGTAQQAARPGIDIGGQVALAFSGTDTLAWFIGYARLDFREGAVVVVVLENSRNLDTAASIGGDALAAAVQALHPE